MYLANWISEDLDTLLTGPLGERGKRHRKMRQDHLWKWGNREGERTPQRLPSKRPRCKVLGSHLSEKQPMASCFATIPSATMILPSCRMEGGRQRSCRGWDSRGAAQPAAVQILRPGVWGSSVECRRVERDLLSSLNVRSTRDRCHPGWCKHSCVN